MPSYEIKTEVVATGIPLSPGIVQGVLVRDREQALEVKRLGKHPILISGNLSMDIYMLFTVISGIVSERGSFGAHLATNALEHGLPLVSSVHPMSALETNMEVILDANEGRILALGRTVSGSVGPADKPKSLPKFIDKVSEVKPEVWLRKWSVPMDARSVELFDLDKDGNLEIVVTSEEKQLLIFKPNGDLLLELELPAKATQSRCVYWPDIENPILILSCDDGWCYGIDPLEREIRWSLHAEAPKTVHVAHLEGEDAPYILIGAGELATRRGRLLQINGDGKILDSLNLPPPSYRKTGWVRAADIAKQNGVFRIVAGDYAGAIYCYTKRADQHWSQKWQWKVKPSENEMHWIRCIRLFQDNSREWLTLAGFMNGGNMTDGSLVCLHEDGTLLWHTNLKGAVNSLQVLVSANDPDDWRVLVFQYSGDIQLLDSKGNG